MSAAARIGRPLAIDLFCGLGGWSEGLLAEGYDVVGFDIERHQYGEHRYPAQLVVQDVLTLHGAQFRDAALIVASPPCQSYSWMAMPWKLAKAKAAAIRADTTGQMLADLNQLFDACFRIQAQASLAAGRHIPMVVENVRGAQPWVGRARGNFGSFYLWGDIPGSAEQLDLYGSPLVVRRRFRQIEHKVPGFRFDPSEGVKQHGSGAAWWDKALDERRKNPFGMTRWTNPSEGFKSAGLNWSDPTRRGQDFTRIAGQQSQGTKNGNDWFGAGEDCSLQRRQGSKSTGRKAASAMIAKIPEALSRHIAAVYRPEPVIDQDAALGEAA